MRFAVAILLSTLLSVTSARSQVTGNEIVEICKSNPDFATAYVTGVMEATEEANRKLIKKYSDGKRWAKNQEDQNAWITQLVDTGTYIQGYCMPPGAKRSQAGDVFCKFLRENPADRHNPAVLLAQLALVTAWPCGAAR